MEVLKLNDGSEVAQPIVVAVFMQLEEMIKERPTLFYDAVMKARDRSYEMWPEHESLLKDKALLDTSGNMHESVAEVIRCSVTGEELEMKLHSPLAET